jgi:PAS domain S-box-containing protein
LGEHLENDATRIEKELSDGQVAQVTVAATVESLEKAVLENMPDLILLNASLPGLEQPGTLDHIKQQALGIPIILLTAEDADAPSRLQSTDIANTISKGELGKLLPTLRNTLERERMAKARLATELALRESEERYRLLIEGSHEVFFYRHDTSCRFEYLSPSVTEVLGYTPTELLGKSYREILTEEASNASVIQKTEEAMRYGIQGQSYRASVRHKNGSFRTVELVESPLMRRGKVIGMQGFARDVSEREEAEARLREQAGLLDLVPDAVVVVELNDKIQFWNQGSTELSGISRDEAHGRRAPDLDYWGLGSFETAKQAVLDKGDWQGETTRFRRDGKKITVSSRWRLVNSEEGGHGSILILESNITDRKRIEQQLFQAQRMQSMATLAGGIAHDLNNILSPVLMAAQVLRAEFTDDYVVTMLDTIEGCAKRGADVVRQLLTFARGIQGERVSTQVRHLVKEIIHMSQETFPKSIKIASNVPRELWPVVGDATQLHQAVLNLCVNARDALPNGGTLTITGENVTLDSTFVSMENNAKPGPYILVTIRDDGMGISSEVNEHMFEPFFTTKKTGKNPGLGLSTVLGIVQSHGGFIRVSSQIGQGATFKVFLPASPGAKPAVPEERPPLPLGHGELILLVDDEQGIRDSASALLTKHGYQVTTASDGAEGLALFTQHRPEVRAVVADIVMPIMDGVAFVRGLRRIAPDIKVIAASGLMDDPDQSGKVHELEQLGVHRFLTKPFTAEDLLEALSQELNAT